MNLPLRAGLRLPDVRLGTMGGNSVTLSSYRGRKVLVWVWASWDPSREALGALQAFHEKHPELVVVTIACDAQGVDQPMHYVASAKGNFEMWMDATCQLVGRWGVKRPGMLLLADEAGVLLHVGAGADLAKVEPLLSKAPSSGEAPLPEVPPAPKKLEFLVQQCTNYLTRKRTDDAIQFLKHAIALDAELRPLLAPQVLALREPGRFYAGDIDGAWVAANLAEV